MRKRLGVLAVIALVAAACGTVGPSSSSTTLPQTTTTTEGTVPPAHVYNVVSYGADPTGASDSTKAIQTALAAAESTPNSEVYFPAGKFILHSSQRTFADFVINAPVRIVGSGANTTTIQTQVGAKDATYSPVMFEIVPSGSGTSITNLTLDAATYDGGTAILDYGNNTTLSNLIVLAPTSTATYNNDAFGVRVIAVCKASDASTIYRSNNVVDNVLISGNGSGGTTELDISCQHNAQVSNVTITGNGLDIYYDQNSTFSNLNITATGHNFTWVITASQNIVLDNLTLVGNSGVIEPDSKDVTQNVTVTNENDSTPNLLFRIGDSVNTIVDNSTVGEFYLDPSAHLNGLTVTATTYSSVRCVQPTRISGLVGISCP